MKHAKRTDPKFTSADRFAAYVRSYVPGSGRSHAAVAKKRKAAPASQWTLIFDTETTIDPTQKLRVGTYQLRKSGELKDHGFFYEPDVLTPQEMQTLQQYVAERGLKLMTRADFVEKVFYKKAYEWRANIVGLNLPFDLSRLAIRHNSARGKMKGGFTFQLSANRRLARVQIRHLNARAAFIQFAAAPRQLTARGAAKRGIFTPTRRGSFIDVKTLAAALLGRSFSLQSLSAFLDIPSKKSPTEHGEQLTFAYLDYALTDVQSTWECYRVLVDKFAEHQLTQTRVGKVLSEASIGKAYFREMNLRSLLEMQPDIPACILGIIWSSYFGGRTEVRWRRTIKQVLYCDFLSMYPTIFTLMRLWSFVTAKGFDWREATLETQRLLEEVTLADLKLEGFWTQLHTLVQLNPNNDILPLRARYDGASCTIGLNHVSSTDALWCTLADVIASKLLTGRAPKIERAITFVPRATQEGLKPISVGGQLIDPAKDNLFKRIIDLRSGIKAQMRKSNGPERDRLDSQQLMLKLLANSTSYGIFAEVNVTDLDGFEPRMCFGPASEGFEVKTNKSEEPGPYFNPLIATLITGGARLMLAIAEKLTLDADLDWAFCDTDSMALTKPDAMQSAEFFERTQTVVDWFEPLNPYEKPESLFQIEDQNHSLDGSGALSPLYCLCVSSKRYALFNVGEEGVPVLRKVSAHGLGHLMSPYPECEAPKNISPPSVPLDELGAARWQYDLWFKIVEASLSGHPEEFDMAYHETLKQPALSRYAATTPAILRWFKSETEGRPYEGQMKPFNFLVALQVNPIAALFDSEPQRRKKSTIKPVAPFSKNPARAAEKAFDRETGQRVPAVMLKTYAQAVAQYHLSPEAKFQNGAYTDSGRTERRHVVVSGIVHIGKEANKWEEQYSLGTDEEAQIEYGMYPDNDQMRRLKQICAEKHEREAARMLGISRMTLRKVFRQGVSSLSAGVRKRLNRLGLSS